MEDTDKARDKILGFIFMVILPVFYYFCSLLIFLDYILNP